MQARASGPSGRNLTERTSTVQSGQTVVICFNDDKYFFVTVRETGNVRMERSVVQLKDLLGLSYGAMYEVLTDADAGPVPKEIMGKRKSGHRMTRLRKNGRSKTSR